MGHCLLESFSMVWPLNTKIDIGLVFIYNLHSQHHHIMHLLNQNMCHVHATGLLSEEHRTWLNIESLRDNKQKGSDSTRIIL